MADGKVFPPAQRLTKPEVVSHLAAGFTRVVAGGKATERIALDAGATPRTVNNACRGKGLIELHTALNARAADPTILDEVMAAYGLVLNDREAAADCDFNLAAMLSRCAAKLIDSRSPTSEGGTERTPRETCEIADVARPMLAILHQIVDEADKLKGVCR